MDDSIVDWTLLGPDDIPFYNADQFNYIFSRFDMSEFPLSSFGYSLTNREDRVKVLLACTLRYLALGSSFYSLSCRSGISGQSIRRYLPFVLDNIYTILQPDHFNLPQSVVEWQQTREDFQSCWEFPNTVASINAHVFKMRTKRMLFLTAANAHGRFIYLNMSPLEESSKAIILKDTYLGRAIFDGTASEATSLMLVGRQLNAECVYKTNPFGVKAPIFERELGIEALQCGFLLPVDYALGCLGDRFQIFQHRLDSEVHCCADKIIKTCCVLHNWCTTNVTTSPLFIPQNTLPNTFSEVEIEMKSDMTIIIQTS